MITLALMVDDGIEWFFFLLSVKHCPCNESNPIKVIQMIATDIYDILTYMIYANIKSVRRVDASQAGSALLSV